MKKLCIALVSALALGIVNAEETDLVVVGSGGARPSLPPSWPLSKARKLLFLKKCRSSAEIRSAVRVV